MRLIGLVSVGLLLAAPAAAQTCTPVPVQTLAWGAAGASIVPAYADTTTNLVPAGEVWVIKAAGTGYDTGTFSASFALQIDHQWPDGSYWYTDVANSPGPVSMTPTVSLARPIVLEAGERLSARTNYLPSGTRMYVMALGWRLPAACLTRVLGVADGSGTTDYSGVQSAAQAAATALSALATAK